MENNRKVPNIRFAGFNDTWEQRLIDDLVTQVVREVPKPTKPYKRLSVRSHAKGTFHQNVDDPSKVAMDKLFVVKEDDLIVNITFAWEHAIAVVQPEDDGLLVSHRFPTYRSDGKSDIDFLHYLVSKDTFRHKLDLISPGGAGRNRVLSKSEFLKIKTVVPTFIEEQQKIGDFFKSLDDTITLHQREYDLLVKTKKSYLRKMFPKNGEDKPEIRFEGFTEAWEQRKLGAITESFSGGTPTAGKSEYYGGKIPFIRSGEISSDSTELFITEDGLNNSSAKIVDDGDILYALYGATSGEVSISRINGAINQAILAIRPTQGDDSYMIVQWLKKQKETIISTYLQGGQGNLSGSIVKDLDITLPNDKEEQAKIGSFFANLDNLITLHQRELNSLKDIKKSLLQQMFV